MFHPSGTVGGDDGEAFSKGRQVFQFNPQPAFFYDRFSTEGKLIGRLTSPLNAKESDSFPSGDCKL